MRNKLVEVVHGRVCTRSSIGKAHSNFNECLYKANIKSLGEHEIAFLFSQASARVTITKRRRGKSCVVPHYEIVSCLS